LRRGKLCDFAGGSVYNRLFILGDNSKGIGRSYIYNYNIGTFLILVLIVPPNSWS
jgi:hypothetical protein